MTILSALVHPYDRAVERKVHVQRGADGTALYWIIFLYSQNYKNKTGAQSSG